jgi:hypothetical protein
VIETIPLDILATFAIGLLFSIAAHKGGTPAKPLLRTPQFWQAFAYLMVVGVGLGLVLYLIEPDWMWMYWVDYRNVPVAFIVYVFCFYPLMFCLGYLLVPELDKIRPGLASYLYVILNVLMVVLVIIMIHRLWHVGTIEEYKSGEAQAMITLRPFRMITIVWIMVIAMPFIGGALIWLYVKISRESEQAGAQQA